MQICSLFFHVVDRINRIKIRPGLHREDWISPGTEQMKPCLNCLLNLLFEAHKFMGDSGFSSKAAPFQCFLPLEINANSAPLDP